MGRSPAGQAPFHPPPEGPSPRRPGRPLLGFLVLAILLGLAGPSLGAAGPGKPLILVLQSYQRDMSWSSRVQDGIEAFLAAGPEPTDLLVEYLDAKRQTSPDAPSVLESFLAWRYAGRKPNLVIACDDPALTFLVAYRDRLFPGVPVVFCGVNDYSPALLQGRTGITGILEQTEFDTTLVEARRLFPNLGKVYVAADGSESGRAMAREFRAEVGARLPDLEIVPIPDLALDQVGSWLTAQPRGLIFSLNYLVDGLGKVHATAEVSRVLAASGMPVFTGHDVFLAPGVVGGRCVSAEGQGRAVAALAVQVLQGADPSAPPRIVTDANTWIFSWPDLARLGLARAALPPGSEVRGRPKGYLEDHPWAAFLLVAGSIVLVLVSVFFGIIILIRSQSHRRLQESEGRYRKLFDTMEQGVVREDARGIALSVNASALRILGVGPEAILGRASTDPGWEAVTPSGDPIPLEEWPVNLALRTGQRQTALVGVRRPSVARTAWVVATAMPEGPGPEGEVGGVFVTFSDVTALKEAEARLAQQAAELAEKNTELERFAYTVSHDLKSPLVTIKGFLSFLEQDLAEGKSGEVAQDLLRIGQATDRMQDLLEDILELSRLGRHSIKPQDLDAGEALRTALENLEGGIAKEDAVVEVAASWPRVYADRTRLVEVFQNLLENALKYRGQERPRIQAGWEAATDEDRFFVRDWGMGINPRYLTTIFGLFNKLDPQSEGTGVGLSLVQRIVELHGGRAWAESAGPGQGATFWFSLPHGTPDPEVGP